MKFLRYLVGFPLAVIITSLLFLLMYHLIRDEQLPLPEPIEKIVKPIMPARKDPPPPEPPKPVDDIPESPEEPDPNKNIKPIKKPKKIDPTPEPGTFKDLGGPGGGPIVIENNAFYVINRVTPLYPASCELRGVEGQVKVEYDVTNGGNVINAKVISSTDKCLETAAIRAIQKWKYTPLLDADPDLIRERGLTQTFEFQLEAEE